MAFSREKNFQTQNKKWPLTYGVFDFGIFGLEITSTRWSLTCTVFDFYGFFVGTVRTPTIRRQLGFDPAFQLDTQVVESDTLAIRHVNFGRQFGD